MNRYPPPTSLTPIYRIDSLLLQEGFLYSQDDERRGKWFVSVPSHVLTSFITLKFTYCAEEFVPWLIPSFSNHTLKKLIQKYTTSYFFAVNHQKTSLSLISLTKKETEQNSLSFKRTAAELLDCLY